VTLGPEGVLFSSGRTEGRGAGSLHPRKKRVTGKERICSCRDGRGEAATEECESGGFVN